jgi:predicted DNA-binding protein
MRWSSHPSHSMPRTFTDCPDCGIAVLPQRDYAAFVKTLTVKLPDSLANWLENEAKRVNRPKSELIRDVLRNHQEKRARTAFDLAADLCGCVDSGKGDLSHNKKYMEGFGR